MSQNKCTLDLLTETRKVRAKPRSTSMAWNLQLFKEGELFQDPKRYRRLIENVELSHVNTSRHCILFSVVSFKFECKNQYKAIVQSTSEIM